MALSPPWKISGVKMTSLKNILCASVFAISSFAFAQDECGEVPVAPEIVDGATATMEELVANSETVKAFVADADAYLDCREAYAKDDAFKALSEDERKDYLAVNSALIDVRNGIGPSFNEQVGVYTKAHPEVGEEE
jgi:hypothetical protein